MKAINLTAGIALVLLPLASASAATRSAAQATPSVLGAPVGENDVPGDFNEDGNPDLLFQNMRTGELQVWTLSRTKPMERVRVVAEGDPSYVAVGTDDFDGDNRTDVLLWNAATGNGAIFYMDGTTLLRKSELRYDIPEYIPVSVVDWNRDGSPDIVFQHRKGGDIFVALLSGETIIAKQPIDLPQAGVDLDWRVIGTGDFDRDGDADLVLYRSGTMGSRDTANDALAVALMDGNAGRIQIVTELTDRNWQVRGVSDFSRDGWPDLFFDNFATGETGVWEMEGLKIRSAYLVTGGSISERGWHIVGPR